MEAASGPEGLSQAEALVAELEEEHKLSELAPLPAKNATQALPHLRRPFSAAAVKWKIQASDFKEARGSQPKKDATWAVLVGYIDVRLVIERLNLVVGENWEEEPLLGSAVDTGLLYSLRVFDQRHFDLGVEQGRDDAMKAKALQSDGLKRVAVRFGVGVSLYAVPTLGLSVTDDGAEKSNGEPTIKRQKSGKPGYLKPVHEAWLRQRYEEWLKTESGQNFGPVLDHGDALESAGALAEGLVEGEEESAAGPTPLDDEEAIKILGEIKYLRESISAFDDQAVPESSVEHALEQRGHSHELLREFAENLRGLQRDLEAFAELQEALSGRLSDAELKKVLGKANRRGSRHERVEVLREALEKADEEGAE